MSDLSLGQRSTLFSLLRHQAPGSVTNSDEFWNATDRLDEKKYKRILALFYNYKTEFALRELEDLFIGLISIETCQYCDAPMTEHERHADGILFANFARCNQPGCKNVKWLLRKVNPYANYN